METRQTVSECRRKPTLEANCAIFYPYQVSCSPDVVFSLLHSPPPMTSQRGLIWGEIGLVFNSSEMMISLYLESRPLLCDQERNQHPHLPLCRGQGGSQGAHPYSDSISPRPLTQFHWTSWITHMPILCNGTGLISVGQSDVRGNQDVTNSLCHTVKGNKKYPWQQTEVRLKNAFHIVNKSCLKLLKWEYCHSGKNCDSNISNH